MFKPQKRIPEGSTQAVIGQLYKEAGGAKEAGFILGLQASRTYQKHEDASLTLDEAARLTMATGSDAAARYLATLAGGRFVPHDAPEGPITILMSQSAEHQAEAVCATLRALNDGTIDKAEAGGICASLDRLIERATAARQALTPICGGAS
jgi:hypothetical protein